MARPRNFDEDDVVAKAADIFGRLGFNAASIDDLLGATGLQRGSLYKAFGCASCSRKSWNRHWSPAGANGANRST